jgi:hypothetical protein
MKLNKDGSVRIIKTMNLLGYLTLLLGLLQAINNNLI